MLAILIVVAIVVTLNAVGTTAVFNVSDRIKCVKQLDPCAPTLPIEA